MMYTADEIKRLASEQFDWAVETRRALHRIPEPGFREEKTKALYSLIFQYTCTAVLRGLYKKFQQSTLFIVTTRPTEVCSVIYGMTQHGATILEGEGSFEHCERNVVYSVVSAAQSKKVIRAVKQADPEAFINEVKTEKLTGRFYQPKEE